MSSIVQSMRVSALSFGSLAASCALGIMATYFGMIDEISASSLNEIYYFLTHPIFVFFRILNAVSTETIKSLVFLFISQIVETIVGFFIAYFFSIPFKFDFRLRMVLISTTVVSNAISIPYQIIVANCQPGGAYFGNPYCAPALGYPSIYSLIYYSTIWILIYAYVINLKGSCYKCLIMKRILNKEDPFIESFELIQDMQTHMSEDDFLELESRFKEEKYNDNLIQEICSKSYIVTETKISFKYILNLLANPSIMLVILALPLALTNVFLETFMNRSNYPFDFFNILNEIGDIANPIGFTLLGSSIMSSILKRQQVCIGRKEIVFCIITKQIFIPAFGLAFVIFSKQFFTETLSINPLILFTSFLIFLVPPGTSLVAVFIKVEFLPSEIGLIFLCNYLVSIITIFAWITVYFYLTL